MKKCPYCAEEIQDEAVVCRFCGNRLTGPGQADSPPPDPAGTAPDPTAAPPAPAPPDLSAPPDPSPPPAAEPVVGEGALRFSHSGERYVLGYGQGFFGIWDRGVAGGPVVSFPRTDEGWQQAWHRFIVLEPKAMEVPARTATPPDVRTSMYAFRSGHSLATWVTVGLGVSAIVAVLSIVFRGTNLGLIHRVMNGTPVLREEARASVDRVNTVVVLLLIAIGGTGVTWLFWQHRAQSNLRALGVENLRFKPAWAVGWWLIPVANFAMPYLTVRELYRASDPAAGAVDWSATRIGPLLSLWWAAWLLRSILSVAGSSVTAGAENPTLSQLSTREPLLIASDTALIAAAILSIVVIRRIDRRQEAKRARVEAFLGSQSDV